MATAFKVGDPVTIAPCAREPYILQFQYHVRISMVANPERYMVESSDAVELDGSLTQFGPFCREHLSPGWGSAGRPS